MYAIGSKVFHPCYGAGTVACIQEKSLGEDARAYYVINTVSQSMEIMVPVDRADELGLRQVSAEKDVREALAACAQAPAEGEIGSDLHARQREMRDRLKSGDLDDVADVVRILYFMNNRRPLGTVDRQLFDQGKGFIAGELALATGSDLATAQREVEDHLAQMLSALEQGSAG